MPFRSQKAFGCQMIIPGEATIVDCFKECSETYCSARIKEILLGGKPCFNFLDVGQIKIASRAILLQIKFSENTTDD